MKKRNKKNVGGLIHYFELMSTIFEPQNQVPKALNSN